MTTDTTPTAPPTEAELAELLRLREGCPATLNYDDGITDDRTHPPYRGKPQMIEAIVGGWHHVVAEMYDMAGEPQADREGAALVSAYNALPGLVAEVLRLRGVLGQIEAVWRTSTRSYEADANEMFHIANAAMQQTLGEAGHQQYREAWAGLLRENERLEERASVAEAERDKLQAFKAWVHEYLDGRGVPHHPPGTHGAAGCRIGDRMDWLMAKLAAAEAERDDLRRLLGLVVTYHKQGVPCYEPGREGYPDAYYGNAYRLSEAVEDEIAAALEGK